MTRGTSSHPARTSGTFEVEKLHQPGILRAIAKQFRNGVEEIAAVPDQPVEKHRHVEHTIPRRSATLLHVGEVTKSIGRDPAPFEFEERRIVARGKFPLRRTPFPARAPVTPESRAAAAMLGQ